MGIAFLVHVLCLCCLNCVCVSSFVFVLWKLRFCFTFCVCVVGIVFVFCSYWPPLIFPLKKLFLTALHDFKVVSPALEVFVL